MQFFAIINTCFLNNNFMGNVLGTFFEKGADRFCRISQGLQGGENLELEALNQELREVIERYQERLQKFDISAAGEKLESSLEGAEVLKRQLLILEEAVVSRSEEIDEEKVLAEFKKYFRSLKKTEVIMQNIMRGGRFYEAVLLDMAEKILRIVPKLLQAVKTNEDRQVVASQIEQANVAISSLKRTVRDYNKYLLGRLDGMISDREGLQEKVGVMELRIQVRKAVAEQFESMAEELKEPMEKMEALLERTRGLEDGG